MAGLWEAPGRGAKPTWQPADLNYLIACLEEAPRTYNSVQLAQKLKQERVVDLSCDRPWRLLNEHHPFLIRIPSPRCRCNPMHLFTPLFD